MTQINDRFVIFDWNVREFEDAGIVLLGPAESAFLQLRKCYELVAFASMAGNLRKVQKTWRAFEKEWNLGKIMKGMERINPDFLPQPFWVAPHQGEAEYEITFPPELKMNRTSLAENHGKLNKVLHARNPFNERIDYELMLEEAVQQKKHLEDQLLCHIATIEHEQEHLQVFMKDQEGRVKVNRLRRHPR